MQNTWRGMVTSTLAAGVLAFAGCQPWSGDYTGTWSDPFATTTVSATITQLGTSVIVDQTIHVDTRIGLVCHWDMTGCMGTTGGTTPAFHAASCLFTQDPTNVDCSAAYGATFTSDVDGLSLAMAGGSVDQFQNDYSYWPPAGGPTPFPSPLVRIP